jgi:hypothetical protein
LIPIIGSIIIFMILVYLGTYYYRLKQWKNRDLNVNNEELANMSFKNPMFVSPYDVSYTEEIIINPSYKETNPNPNPNP